MKVKTLLRYRHADAETPPAPNDEYPVVSTPLDHLPPTRKHLTMPSSTASGTSFFSKLGGGGANKTYSATVQLLDDNDTVKIDFKKHDTGEQIISKVCEYVQIVEKDYFGLRYMDASKNRYWLDPLKPVLKQVHGMSPIVFCLRVKYYPAEPTVLKDEITRYQLFLQLRRDMLHGRLYCPQQDAAYLGAAILQSELGDYNRYEHPDAYVSEYKLFLKQTPKLEDKVADIHKHDMRGKNPADAELAFLQRACTMDTYGFDPYTVKESKSGDSVYVGCTATGVLVYHLNRKLHHIPWDDVEKIDYVGRELRVYPSARYVESTANGAANGHQTPAAKESKGKKYQEPLRYACPSGTFAKHLWKYAMGQKIFFTKDSSKDVKPVTSSSRIPLPFIRGATFRYSGRVLHEIQEQETKQPANGVPRSTSFVRYHVERQPGRSERTYPWMVGKSATLPRPASKENVAENGSTSGEQQQAPSVLNYTDIEEVKPEHEPSTSAEAPDIPSSAKDLAHKQALKDALDQSPTVDLSPSASQPAVNQDDQSRPGSSASRVTKTTITIKGKQTSSGQNGNLLTKEPEPEQILATTEDDLIETTPESRAKERSIIATVLRTLLITLFVTMVICTIVILLEEAPYESVQQNLAKVPRHADFRRHYYEPYRTETLARYHKLKADYYGGQQKSAWF